MVYSSYWTGLEMNIGAGGGLEETRIKFAKINLSIFIPLIKCFK